MRISEKISIMVKNKVVIKERDVWSDLANFIGEMVAKYAEPAFFFQCFVLFAIWIDIIIGITETANIHCHIKATLQINSKSV